MKSPFGVTLTFLILAVPAAQAAPAQPDRAKLGEQLDKACAAKDMKACFDVAKEAIAKVTG